MLAKVSARSKICQWYLTDVVTTGTDLSCAGPVNDISRRLKVGAVLIRHLRTSYCDCIWAKVLLISVGLRCRSKKMLDLQMQQTPNPDAQLPEFAPPMFSHSCSVKQVPTLPVFSLQTLFGNLWHCQKFIMNSLKFWIMWIDTTLKSFRLLTLSLGKRWLKVYDGI